MFRLAVREAAPARTHLALAQNPLRSVDSVEQLFFHARDALTIADLTTGRITHWNYAAERLFGYSADEAIGQSVEMLMPPAVARLHRERVAHYRRTTDEEILSGRGPLSIPAVTRGGDEIRVELSVQPLAGADAALLTFRDARCEQRAEITALENARAESGLVEARTKLRRCEEKLRDATRELQRPLGRARRAAARMARLARDSQGEPQPRRLVLLARVVEARTNELHRRLEQTIDMALLEDETFELELDRVNLVPLLGRIVAGVKSRSQLHRVNLAAPQGLTALCDARRIESILQDLVDRAIRRNPRGCWIDIDLRRPLGGIARIEVRDYGRPLSDRERQQLTLPASADRSWFVHRRVVERHGGSLTMDFPRDGSASVVLVLPTNRVRRSRQSSAAGGPA